MTGRLGAIWARVRALMNRGRLDREFDEELATHLALLIDDYRRAGLSPADARRAALVKLGRPDLLRELQRQQRGIRAADVLAQDLRYAVRTLRKAPAFTAVAVLSLALGIGANTALFSLVDDLLLRSLSVRQPERLVQLRQIWQGPGVRKTGVLYPKALFDYVRAQNQVFSEIVGFNDLERPVVVIDGAIEPGRSIAHISESFFRDLGVHAIVGRTPGPSDDQVAVISYGFWQARFGRRPDVLGRSLTIDGQPCTIVGVAPPAFLGLSIERSTDLWMSSRALSSRQIIARLKPGVTREQAQAATAVLVAQFAQAQPEAHSWDERSSIDLPPAGKGLSGLRTQYERPLLALTALVTLVLLITCANVGNLLMVRNSVRRRELAVRAALGARRSRLVHQYLVESAMLAVAGGALALLIARWGVSLLLSMLPLAGIPEALAFQADWRVLGFAAGFTLVCALLFGLVPAWRATQIDLPNALAPGRGTTATGSARRLGRWLVACQVALSVLLLAGAGLFVQTLRNLTHRDVGFNPDGVLQVSLDSRAAGFGPGQVKGLHRLLLERVSAVPGVRLVTGVRDPVMRGTVSRTSFASLGPDRPMPRDEVWDSLEVGPSFFETMNIPVVRGRTFTLADFERGRTLVVISEAFARHYFPNEDPTIGKLGEMVIGVVRDARLPGVRKEIGPMMYLLASDRSNRLDALEVRIHGDPSAIAPAVAEAVRKVNPRLLAGITTLRGEIDRSIATERMVAATSGFFGLLGLLLASIGVFGVASYTVTQRTNEIGIRMALGAGRWQVIRQSLRDTMLVVVAGLAAGVVAAAVAARLSASLVSDLLFGLSATSVANLGGAAVLMAAVAAIACVLPARRATRIDPLAAIRHE